MKNSILVTGSSGLVGSRFTELYPHPEQLLTPSEQEFNLLHQSSISTYLSQHPIQTIVNFSAFTDVSQAEKQRSDQTALCWQVNVSGVERLMSETNGNSIHLIQISTDMVFPGSTSQPGPYAETTSPITNPDLLTWYGYTKSQAEHALDLSISTILRITNPVRKDFPPKLDYFRKPLSLFDAGKLYPLFSDQHISITYIDEACHALTTIIQKRLPGIFHAASSDLTTPHQIISYLLKHARNNSTLLPHTFVSSVNNPVRYPQYGGLQVSSTQKTLEQKFSSCREIVDHLFSKP